MKQKYVPVKITKNGTTMHFPTMADAAFYLGVSRTTVSKAVNNEREIDGWIITRDEAASRQSAVQNYIFSQPLTSEAPRVNEVFTRKPFSSTGLWNETSGSNHLKGN